MADGTHLAITMIDCPVVRLSSMPARPVAGLGYAVEGGKIVLVMHHADGEALIAVLTEDLLHFVCNEIAEALDISSVAPSMTRAIQ